MRRNRHITEFVTPVSTFVNTPVGQLLKTEQHSTVSEKPTENTLQDTSVLDISSFKVFVTESDYFTVNLPEIIPRSLNFTNKEDVIRFKRNPLQFYQNQFNMAIWCATSGCGISKNFDLNHPVPLIKTLFRFHLYYQTCKILNYLQVPLPGETSFSEMKNNINLRNYDFIKKEFRIPNNKKFYIEESWPYDYNPNQSLDYVINHRYKPTSWYPHMFAKDWDEGRSKLNLPYFAEKYIDDARSSHVFDVLRQKDYSRFLKFIIGKSSSLTNAGTQRLNDTIRAFVYCILGAQAQTRTPIIDSYGTELDAQNQFKKLLEDFQHPDIPTSIARYQKAISDTHIRLDYVIAPGLYIISSNMILNVGTIENYNNNILIASANMKQGRNDINDKINKAPPLMKGSPAKTYRMKAVSSKAVSSNADSSKAVTPVKTVSQKASAETEDSDTHESVKFILFAVTSGLVALAIYLK